MILCYGSVNIDEVFNVHHIVVEGETQSSSHFEKHAGGKGANQSVAAARAGATVYHGGKIGKEAVWIKDLMESSGVSCDGTLLVDEQRTSGKAVIQVSESTGDNAIILYPGTNSELTKTELEDLIFNNAGNCKFLMLQNEVNLGQLAIDIASERQMVVVFNPAPMQHDLLNYYSLERVNILIVNETEAIGLLKQFPDVNVSNIQDMNAALNAICDASSSSLRGVIITVGAQGLLAKFRSGLNDDWVVITLPAFQPPSPIVDTTGAGDTFIGYFLASLAESFRDENDVTFDIDQVKKALIRAQVASSIAITDKGAMNSIPSKGAVLNRERQLKISYDWIRPI
jgi:ribokinase